MTIACNRFGTDVVGHLAFGCELKTQTESTNRFVSGTMSSSTYLYSIFFTEPFLSGLSLIVWCLGSKKAQRFHQAVQNMIRDHMSQSTDAKSDFYAAVTGEGGLDPSELWSEASFLVLAGRSTVVTAVIGALFPPLVSFGCIRSSRDRDLGDVLDRAVISNGVPRWRPAATYLRAVLDGCARLDPTVA
ncbi:hypothetical protein F5Y15DRAFT_221149 [Xylariaceae sp. FL0016]|nr:hypothetical protein F5Y15DRAFT_221149 [Xylariaceae sp. FL0016]